MTVVIGSMVRTSMGCGVVAEIRYDGIICVNLRACNTNGVYQGFFTLDSVTPIGKTTAEMRGLDYEQGKEVHANRNFYASHHHNLHPSPLKYAPMHMVPTQLQDNPMREKTEYEISAREGTAFCSSAKKIRLS